MKHHNSPDDNQFSIDEISGTLRIKKRLDFESKQLYNLTVKATDEGSPPLTSFATVLVEVLDVNENQHPPRFETFFLETAVPENMPIGSLVTSVQAHDLDIGDKVSYTIKGKRNKGKGTIHPSLSLLPSANFFLALNKSHHFLLKKVRI